MFEKHVLELISDPMYTVFGVLCSVCDTCHFKPVFEQEALACRLRKRAQTNGLVPENRSCPAFFVSALKIKKVRWI